MKKTKTLASGLKLAAALAFIATGAQAQTNFWDGSSAQTTTPYHVGIGLGFVLTDANLNVSQYQDVNTIGLKIRRTYPSPLPYGGHANMIEVWTESSQIMNLNDEGYLGLNQPNPGYMLDVNGSGNFENTLTVNGPTGGIINIGPGLGGDNQRQVVANSVKNGLVVSAGHGTSDGAYMALCGVKNTGHEGQVAFVSDARYNPGSDATYAFLTYDGSTYTTRMAMNTQGTVGIGDDYTPSPLYPEKLHVQKSIYLYDPNDGMRNINAHSTNGGIQMNTSDNGGASLIMSAVNGNTYTAGEMLYIADVQNSTDQYPAHAFQLYDGSNTNTVMAIRKGGKVVIGEDLINGNNTPGDYGLYVSAGILTSKLKVALPGDPTNWSDYVFAKDYKLKPLSEVAQYVQENKHLPGVPSANEVSENGIDVATMDATLLKKIEELTLYVIDLQKQNEQMKGEIEKLKK